MASLPIADGATTRPSARLRPAALALPAILILALGLRLLAAWVPSIHHPDEIFQYLEPAHRLVFGYGTVTWEYQYGIRSWLFPLILAAPMKLGAVLSPEGTAYLLFPRLLMVAVSLSIPWSAWRLGAPFSRTHAAVAAFVAATWGEFVYFAPHTLSENMATAAILPAAAILSAATGERRRGAILAAGMLLGFAGLIRFQLAPALAVIAIMGCGRDPARWRALIAGGVLMAALGGGVDLAMGMHPFGWLIENVRLNLVEDRASQFGTMGPLGYVVWAEHLWGWWLLPIALLVRIGWRRQPALAWAAIANLLFHSLIAHKEYRFVEFSAAAFVLIAAIGSVDALRRVGARHSRWPRSAAIALLCGGWMVASIGVAADAKMRENWPRATDTLAASATMRADPETCGVAVLTDFDIWGGYSYLHRDVPVAYFDGYDPALRGRSMTQALADGAPGYNRILSPRADAASIPAGYVEQTCPAALGSDAAKVCVYARPGGCHADAASPFLLQNVLGRFDRQMIANSLRARRSVR